MIYWVVIFAAYVPVTMAVSILSEKFFHTDAASYVAVLLGMSVGPVFRPNLRV